MGHILRGDALKTAAQAAMQTVSKMLAQNADNQDKYKGIPLETCLKMACLNPCIKYGFADRKGTIEVGKDADLVVISDDYQAQVTYAEGRKVYDRSTEGKIFNADYLNR